MSVRMSHATSQSHAKGGSAPAANGTAAGAATALEQKASAEKRKSTNSSSVEPLKENDMERAIVEKKSGGKASRNKQRALMSAKKKHCGHAGKKSHSSSSSPSWMLGHTVGSKKLKATKRPKRVPPDTLMVFWAILKRDKRQTLMRIGEDVIWERLHSLLLRQNLCVGCQEAVYRDVEVLKEDLQERVGPCFIEVSKRSVCLREDMLGDMDILCLLQRAAEVQSEEADDTLQDFGCPSVDSPALSYEYLVDVVAVVFKEHLETAYADANAASLAMESLLLEEEERKDANKRKKSKRKKKKKKKSKKEKQDKDDAASPDSTSSTGTSSQSRSKGSHAKSRSSSSSPGRDGRDDASAKSTERNTSDSTLLSSSELKTSDRSGDAAAGTDEVDREVEAFKKMLLSTAQRKRPKIKVALPKGAFSSAKFRKSS